MKKGILLILDGYGEGKSGEYNAVANANTPYLHSLKTLPHSLLKTNGEAVGLFNQELGGSEVGHTTIGAGRHVLSTTKQIHDDIISKKFFKHALLKELAEKLKTNKGNLHLVGLMSDKNIHSDIAHLFALLHQFSGKAKNIFVHVITDGRDSGTTDSLKYLRVVRKEMQNTKNCAFASVSGRLYAMDRENNLDRTLRAFNSMFVEDSGIEADEVETYLKKQHKAGIMDEYIEPVHVKNVENSEIKKNDVVFFYNFREDRLRQMVKMCEEKLPCQIVTMASVGGVKAKAVYPSKTVEHTLSEHLSKLKLKQIKISESTKYAHVTYFLNGGREQPFAGEDRVHVPTTKVKNFASTPKMRAKEITEEVEKAIEKKYDAIIVNFSNPDMLGHTGDYDATVKALEFLDKCVKKIATLAKKEDYFILLTADHGNSETMRTADGKPHTAHTKNRVMCVVIDKTTHQMQRYGELQDVAPTLLDLMQVKSNPFFEGKSLLK